MLATAPAEISPELELLPPVCVLVAAEEMPLEVDYRFDASGSEGEKNMVGRDAVHDPLS